MNRYDEVQPGKDGRESGDENPHCGCDNICIYIMRAERRRKRPAGIDTTKEHHVEFEGTTRYKEIPTEQVEPGKGYVTGTNHQRDQEIPQNGWGYWHQKEKHHDDAVNGEELVIGVRGHQIAGRRDQLPWDG